MKLLSVIGARPQFVKASVVSFALRDAGHEEILVHTDQHYDENMSGLFFEQMGIPRPDYNLGVGSGTHAVQTGACMQGIEAACLETKPEAMIIYGDTNSTLAGVLVGAKLGIPVAHVEAGLRSYDRAMPEEVNRMVSDQLSQWLFLSSEAAIANLAKEGITDRIYVVGDVMYDVVCRFAEAAAASSTLLEDLGLDDFALVTIHRNFNTDDPDKLGAIMQGLLAADRTVVFPMHPRVRKQAAEAGWLSKLEAAGHVQLLEPIGYFDMLVLTRAASVVLTDSGGLQKEAMWQETPCRTVRPSTEWVETVETGWNRLIPVDADAIARAIGDAEHPIGPPPPVYGDGTAAVQIVQILGEPTTPRMA